MRKPNSEIKLTSYDELLGLEEDSTEKIVEIELSKLHDFKGHPFRVVNDEKMEETVESIAKYGVIMPGLVRPRAGGDYEIIAGHRRKMGSTLAGKSTMPVIIRNLSDDESTVIMVDSNIQRETLLYSEKAFAFKMKLEAMKHQGVKKGEEVTADLVGESAGESGRQVQRYIRLTELSPELLDLVDQEKIKFIPAVTLSYLSEEEQGWVLAMIEEKGIYPNGIVAEQLKKYSESKELTKAMTELIMQQDKPKPIKVTLSTDKINSYFSQEYSKEQIETVIYELLEKWKAAQK